MKISAVILAAGMSSRMGSSNKLLLDYNGHTIIEEVLAQLKASKVDDITIITGYEFEAVNEVLSKYLTDDIKILYNELYEQGRATSIRCGVEVIQEQADAVLFMVGDKPTVSSSLIDKAIDLFKEKQPDILYVQTPSGRGHPIIFSKKIFPELLALEGDVIGNDLIDKYHDSAFVLHDEQIQPDINSEDDYRALVKEN